FFPRPSRRSRPRRFAVSRLHAQRGKGMSQPPKISSAPSERIAALLSELDLRILALDGAMGALIQSKSLPAADFGGEQYDRCNEHLACTRPQLIEQIHADYFAAGADIVETNTFGATPLVLAEYGLQAKAHEINLRAAQVARSAAEKFSASDRLGW